MLTAGSEREGEMMKHIMQPEFCQAAQWRGPVKVSLFLSLLTCMCISPLHIAHLPSALVADSPTHTRWLRIATTQTSTMTWWRSEAERCCEWSRQSALKIPQQRQHRQQHGHGHRSRLGQCSATVKTGNVQILILQVRTEPDETVNGRLCVCVEWHRFGSN